MGSCRIYGTLTARARFRARARDRDRARARFRARARARLRPRCCVSACEEKCNFGIFRGGVSPTPLTCAFTEQIHHGRYLADSGDISANGLAVVSSEESC